MVDTEIQDISGSRLIRPSQVAYIDHGELDRHVPGNLELALGGARVQSAHRRRVKRGSSARRADSLAGKTLESGRYAVAIAVEGGGRKKVRRLETDAATPEQRIQRLGIGKGETMAVWCREEGLETHEI